MTSLVPSMLPCCLLVEQNIMLGGEKIDRSIKETSKKIYDMAENKDIVLFGIITSLPSE